MIEYFGKSVKFDPNSVSDLPDGFKRLSYQIDAVNEGFKLLQKHNGFFLSDTAGLDGLFSTECRRIERLLLLESFLVFAK